jgi:uncharacterized membrane protein YgcG
VSDRERDLQAEELAELARRLEAALEVETPDARRERALFVAGATARHPRGAWGAALAPGAAAVAVLVVLALMSRTALPGETLFPVRKVLGNVGLAPSTTREIRAHLGRADALVTDAASLVHSEPGRAQQLAFRAEAALTEAETLVDELDGDRRDAYGEEIDALEERAETAYEAAEEVLEEREEATGDGGRGGGDSSGVGSGSGDSGGSGSGGGEDDSSGPGSGDDSGRSGSGDDSSGSGSGGGDDSGSGSGGESSGSGSGED